MTQSNAADTSTATGGSLEAGIGGWDTALNAERETLESNINDPSKSINNWFTKYGVKDMYKMTTTRYS